MFHGVATVCFFTVCLGDRQLADSEEMFVVCDKKCLGLKKCDIT